MQIISGSRKNHTLVSPKGDATRPTSSRMRETLFNICQGYVEGTRFLDLFAGSGAIGFEALSRGAKSCVFIDNSREAIRCIQQNATHLKFEACSTVIYGDVFAHLKKLAKKGDQFDIIYADPPYLEQLAGSEELFSSAVLRAVDESGLLASNGMLFIEDARGFKPEVEKLEKLKLVSSRRGGRSALHQFTTVS